MVPVVTGTVVVVGGAVVGGAGVEVGGGAWLVVVCAVLVVVVVLGALVACDCSCVPVDLVVRVVWRWVVVVGGAAEEAPRVAR